MQKLPTWEEAKGFVNDESALPIDEFIYNHEPAGVFDASFRRQLVDGLNDIIEDAAKRAENEPISVWTNSRLAQKRLRQKIANKIRGMKYDHE